MALALALAGSAAAPTLIRIKPGDTLSELALRHGTTVAALRELNNLPGTMIYAGRTLRIPEPARPTARRAPAPGSAWCTRPTSYAVATA